MASKLHRAPSGLGTTLPLPGGVSGQLLGIEAAREFNVMSGTILFNRANFSIPSPIALTTSGAPASAAGVITATTTTSRQIQFGLKLA